MVLGLLGAWAGFRLGGFISDLMGMSRMLVELVGRFTAPPVPAICGRRPLSSGSIVGQYKADLEAAVKGTQAAAGTAAATATANAMAGAATKAANGIRAAGGAAVAATAMSVRRSDWPGRGGARRRPRHLVGITRPKQDASKQAVDALTDSIPPGTPSGRPTISSRRCKGGRLGEINKSRVDLFGLSQWVNENAAKMDKLPQAMGSDTTLGAKLQ